MNHDDIAQQLGPLAALYADPNISEILIDGPNRIYAERKGRLEDVDLRLDSDEQLLALLRSVVERQGQQLNESSPMVDARLPDGSRMNVVIPPISTAGPVAVIRKLPARQITIEDLVGWGAWHEEMVDFLRACVAGRLNILVSGGAGSGKTTVLRLLATMIPQDERIITVEDAAEFRLPQKRVVGLVTRPPNVEGQGAISVRDVLRNALRMRPDRIVLGELRGPEALDMLQAINAGHDGSMASIHATSPLDALLRLELLLSASNPSAPLLTIRQQIATGFKLIVQHERQPDGTRRMVSIAELLGVEHGNYVVQDLFVYENGRFSAYHRPTFLQMLRDRGQTVREDLFPRLPLNIRRSGE